MKVPDIEVLRKYGIPLHDPDLIKTADMLALEAEHDGHDIRVLMLTALENHTYQRDAANSLDMFPPTFSHWLSKLGLQRHARNIREQNREALRSA